MFFTLHRWCNEYRSGSYLVISCLSYSNKKEWSIDSLKKLGFDDWFKEQAQKLYNPDSYLARVTVVNRDQFILRDENGDFTASVNYKFLKQMDSTADLPCVGDWVAVKHGPKGEPSTVTDVITRRSFLRRKALKKKAEYQMIAANVDFVFIVEAANLEFNLERLERYLLMAKEGGVEPVLILTKKDLVSDEKMNEVISSIRESGVSVPIVAMSNETGENANEVHAYFRPGKTFCLVGSSGVGKTTLTNSFLGKSSEDLKTNTVSKNGEGRHTTVRRQLMLLNNQSMLIDTPGMRGLTVEVKEDVPSVIEELVLKCKFSDCTHKKEPGCELLKACKEGSLSDEEYKDFLSKNVVKKMSYAEKRNKGKGKKK